MAAWSITSIALVAAPSLAFTIAVIRVQLDLRELGGDQLPPRPVERGDPLARLALPQIVVLVLDV